MAWLLSFFRIFGSAAFLMPFLKRAAVALGLVSVSYFGIGVAMDSILLSVQENYEGLPADVIAVLRLARVHEAMSIMLSAYAGKLTMVGLTGAGVLKRVLWRPGATGSLF